MQGMLNIAAHLALALGLLWYHRRTEFKTPLWVLVLFWTGMGTLLIYVEIVILTRQAFGPLHLQALIIELFYVLPMFLALRLARKHPRDILHPFLAFLVFSAFATLAAGWFLAWAPTATGLSL